MSIQSWERCTNCSAFVWKEEIRNGECLSCRIEHEYAVEVVGGSDEQQEGSDIVSGSVVVVHLPCHGVPAHESVGRVT